MREIRLYRTRIVSLTQGEHWRGCEWVLDTAENRQHCEELLRAGVDKFGKGTHWLEERALKEPETANAGQQMAAVL